MNAEPIPSSSARAISLQVLRGDDRLLGITDVMRMTGLGRTFVLTSPLMPKRVRVGRRAMFLESEIIAWLEQRFADRG